MTSEPGSAAMEATPEMIAAAWASWHSRHGGRIGPGPGFVEAIEAALAATPKNKAAVSATKLCRACRKSALDDAANVAYRICAETRHVTLGDKAAAAIRALAEAGRALADGGAQE